MNGVVQQQVPKGYQQTEVGMIPEDWSVGGFSDYVWYQEGPGLRKWQFTRKGMKVINVTNLQYSGVLNLDKTDRHISIEEFEKMYRHFECDAGDFVMASSGNSYCKASLVRSCDLPLLMNTSVIRFRPLEAMIDGYMQAYMKSKYFKEQIDLLITGGAQPNFGPFHLNKILLPIPSSKEEQTAIANALSDVDALITSLEKLIAKKRAIKTAAMQQLLTGKKRLPPFDQTHTGYKQTELGEIPEDWEVVPFGEITTVDPENIGALTPAEYEFNYISLEQIDSGVLNGTSKTNYRDAPSRARRVVRRGDVLVSTVRPNLMSHYVQKTVCQDLICSTGFSVLRPKDSVSNSGFLFFHLFGSIVNNQIEMLISGSNYPAINSGDVKGLKIPLPSYKEQVGISSALSDVDQEINALCGRLNKTQKVKQGMMQELLTGRTRLV